MFRKTCRSKWGETGEAVSGAEKCKTAVGYVWRELSSERRFEREEMRLHVQKLGGKDFFCRSPFQRFPVQAKVDYRLQMNDQS